MTGSERKDSRGGKYDLIFFLLLFLVCLPYLLTYSRYIAYLALKSQDEYATLSLIISKFYNTELIAEIFSGNIQYLSFFHLFGYGTMFWMIYIVCTLPFYLIGSEMGMVLTIRLLSLLPSLGVFYIVKQILKDYTKDSAYIYAGIAFCFLQPVMFRTSVVVHPEALYSFFMALSLYFLYKDDGRFGRQLYYSVILFAVCVSIKILGGVFGLSYLIYFYMHRDIIRPSYIIKPMLVGFASLVIFNIQLLYPPVYTHYMNNMKAVAGITKSGLSYSLNVKSISDSVVFFSTHYTEIYVFAFILLYFLLLIFLNRKKTEPMRYVFVIAFVMITFYFVFAVFYAIAPRRYAIIAIYLLPILITYISVNLKRKHAILPIMFLILIFTFNALPLKIVYGYVKNPQGGPAPKRRMVAMNNTQKYLYSYDQPFNIIGVPYGLVVPPVELKEFKQVPAEVLSPEIVYRYDILILWKDEYLFHKFNKNRQKEEKFAVSYDTRLLVKNSEEMTLRNKIKFRYEKIKEFKTIEIYRKVIL